jgi:hypothetical protein
MLVGYLLALFLTLVIEGCCAFAMGFRERKYVLAVAAINVITHLILSYVLFVLGYLGIDAPLALILVLEALVVVAEWQLLVYVFRASKGRFFVTSLLANTASFLVGLLVFARW